jgi:hypothetical protein
VWSSPAWRIAAVLLVVAGGFGVAGEQARDGGESDLYATTAGDRETIGLATAPLSCSARQVGSRAAAGYGSLGARRGASGGVVHGAS